MPRKRALYNHQFHKLKEIKDGLEAGGTGMIPGAMLRLLEHAEGEKIALQAMASRLATLEGLLRQLQRTEKASPGSRASP